MKRTAFEEGYWAGKEGYPKDTNPYDPDSESARWLDWEEGWDAGAYELTAQIYAESRIRVE